MLFRKASVVPDAPGFDCVSSSVTHAVPAFSDRSGTGVFVSSCVGLQHSLEIAVFESALPAELGEPNCKCGIVQDSSEFSRKCRCISGAKSQSRFAENLHESSQVGGDDRQSSQHVFCDDEAEDFSAERGNNDDTSLRESGFELLSPEAAREVNSPGERTSCEVCSSAVRSGPPPMMSSSNARFSASSKLAACNKMPMPLVPTNRP